MYCTFFHVTKTAINWRYFSSHAYNTMSTHLSGIYPWTIKSGLFVNMISNSLLLCSMKRIYWPRLWSFRGERGREGSSYIFASVPSNIIHKLQIFFHIPMKHNFAKKNRIFRLEYDIKGKYRIKLKGYKISNVQSCRPIVEMFILLNNCLLYRLTNESDMWLKENHSINIIAGTYFKVQP